MGERLGFGPAVPTATADLLVPVHYKDKNGFALGEWIVYNRQRYLGGNLPSDRVERPGGTGHGVGHRQHPLGKRAMPLPSSIIWKIITLEIPVKYVTPDGMALGVWLGSQRAAYKGRVLTDAQIESWKRWEWTGRTGTTASGRLPTRPP